MCKNLKRFLERVIELKKLRYEFLKGLRNLADNMADKPVQPDAEEKKKFSKGPINESMLKACFCQNLIKLRTAAGLSQRQLAKRVGVTPGYISKLEKANKIDGLSFSMLINLSQALKVLPIALISTEEIEKAWAKQKEAEAKAKEAEENK